MMERRTQARLDSLMGNWSTSRKREAHSREANREPRVNFNDRPNRGRTHGSVRGWGSSTRMAPVTTGRGGPTNTGGGSTGSRPISCKRILREASASGRDEPTSWNHSNQGRSQPSDSDRRETDNND